MINKFVLSKYKIILAVYNCDFDVIISKVNAWLVHVPNLYSHTGQLAAIIYIYSTQLFLRV